MKKKILITLLAFACVSTCTLGLVACSDNTQPPVHTHEWSQTWEKDETHHWHNCTALDCDITDKSQKDGYAEHETSNGDCVCGYKAEFTAGLQYELDNDNSYIVKGIGTAKDTDIIIPSEYNGKPVTIIGKNAFSGCNNLTSIIIPDGVTMIGVSAFKDCSKLTSITIPENLTIISASAFQDCSSLTSINIPSGVTVINNSAFSGCRSITNITIPEGVTIIAASAFADCSSLKSITIPKAVTKIYAPAFGGCSSLTNITIQNDDISIDRNVFDGCPIETAAIPAHACDDINNSALKTVVITSGEIIGNMALKDCSNLKSITIPATITSIGDEAFLNCTNLTDITFNGTKEQWNNIQVGSNWSYKTGDYTIHCTDGDISRNKLNF